MRTPPLKKRSLVAAGLVVLMIANRSHADVVIVQDGRRFENVRVVYQGGRVNVITDAGQVTSFDGAEIREVMRAPVKWESTGVEMESRLREQVGREIDRIRQEERDRASRAARLYRDTFLRSALLPGLDQFVRERTGRALGFTTGATLAAVFFSRQRSAFHAARREYSDLIPPLILVYGLSGSDAPVDPFLPATYLYFRDRRENLRSAAFEFNLASLLLAGVWIANILESLIDVKLNVIDPERRTTRISTSVSIPDEDPRRVSYEVVFHHRLAW